MDEHTNAHRHSEPKKGLLKKPRPAIITPFNACESLAKNDSIAERVDKVEEKRIVQAIAQLSSIHSRHSYSMTIDQAVTYLQQEFESFGYATYLHNFAVIGRSLQNIVATKAGTGNTGKIIVIGAHYDSIGSQHDDPFSLAPGADDNASGIAVMLEVARLLAKISLTDELRFVAFSGEEQGLHGSTAYVQKLQEENVDVKLMINLDMIGYPDSQKAIRIEYDQGMTVPTNDKASKTYADAMVNLCHTYTTILPALDRAYASDYEPFEAAGWVIVGLFESDENPNYHRHTDTVDTVDMSYITQAARLTLATLLHI